MFVCFVNCVPARYQNYGASAPFSYKFEEDDDDFVTVDKRTIAKSQYPLRNSFLTLFPPINSYLSPSHSISYNFLLPSIPSLSHFHCNHCYLTAQVHYHNPLHSSPILYLYTHLSSLPYLTYLILSFHTTHYSYLSRFLSPFFSLFSMTKKVSSTPQVHTKLAKRRSFRPTAKPKAACLCTSRYSLSPPPHSFFIPPFYRFPLLPIS